MNYLLDTDHISVLQSRAGAAYAKLSGRMSRYAATDFALCVVSFHEQALGAHAFINRAKTDAGLIRGYNLLSEILEAFAPAEVLRFDMAAAVRFGILRAQGVRISTMDLRIAAIALSQGLIVLTRNSADFSKVPGLVIEDWTV